MESFVLLYNFPLLALDVKNVVNKNFMWLSGQFLEMQPKKTLGNSQQTTATNTNAFDAHCTMYNWGKKIIICNIGS